jgi:8-oxo-dGTP diphosphatase
VRKDCVSAIIVQDKQFLVEKRGRDDVDTGYALPGGHVETGENLLVALHREIMEELELEVQNQEYVWTGDHTASDGELQRIHYFHITKWKGNPIAREAEAISWINYPDMLTFEVDRKAIEKIWKKVLEV